MVRRLPSGMRRARTFRPSVTIGVRAASLPWTGARLGLPMARGLSPSRPARPAASTGRRFAPWLRGRRFPTSMAPARGPTQPPIAGPTTRFTSCSACRAQPPRHRKFTTPRITPTADASPCRTTRATPSITSSKPRAAAARPITADAVKASGKLRLWGRQRMDGRVSR
jgi:hypothetical protein